MGTRKGLLFALEEDQVVEEVPEVDMGEITQVASDVAEQATQVEDDAATLNDGVDDVEEMGQVQQVLQKSVDSGEGVSEETAQIAEIAVEAICARLGIKKQRTIPSLESFGSKHTRLSATKIAVESIGEKMSAAWKAIKAFFLKIWGHIRAFFGKVWTSLTSFGAAAKNLVVRVGRATFKSAEYTIPGGMTVQQYKESLKGNSEEIKQATAAIATVQKDAADAVAAADKGDAAAVDRITGGVTASTEDFKQITQQAEAIKKTAEETKSAMDKEAVTKTLSESEAKKTATEVAEAVQSAAVDANVAPKVTASLATAEKAVVATIDTAQKKCAEAAAIVEKNESPEAVAAAKEKISLWTKVKTFVSKAFSMLSAFVTGVFKRVMALLKFGFSWVKQMCVVAGIAVVATGAIAAGTAKGVYDAAVKGEVN